MIPEYVLYELDRRLKYAEGLDGPNRAAMRRAKAAMKKYKRLLNRYTI